jgi:hypothetical protein
MSKPRQTQRVLPYDYSQKVVFPPLSQGEFLFAKTVTSQAPVKLNLTKLVPAKKINLAK